MERELVVITGASSGIGAAIAMRFDRSGYPLLLLARRLERMEQLGLEDAMCRGVDVVDEAAVASSIEEAERRFGPVGLLVNNAGIIRLGDVISQHGPDIQRVFDLNCVAPLKIARPCSRV